jgi:DDE_Tnp_1-associated
LAVAAAAVLSGARSFAAIGEWAADASQQVLAALGVRRNRRSGGYVAPDEATIRRVLQAVDADALDEAVAAWLAGRGQPTAMRSRSTARPFAVPVTMAGSKAGPRIWWRRCRSEARTIRTASAAGVDFPHAAQVFRLRRDRRGLDGVRTSREIVYGITSRTPDRAGPAEIASHARGHWTIENRLHYVRDVTWGEGASQVPTGNAPRVMAGLRNLAVRTLRQVGAANIAKALRHNARSGHRPLELLGVNPIPIG